MKNITRLYFGPADTVEVLQRDNSASTLYHLSKDASLLMNSLSGFSEKDIHFLIRFIEVVGYSDFPAIPVEQMDKFMTVFRCLLQVIGSMEDGFGMDDLGPVLDLLRSMHQLIKQ